MLLKSRTRVLRFLAGTLLVMPLAIPFMPEAAQAETIAEGFETGGKGGYVPAGNVTLGTGVWYFEDAVVGNLSTDAKNGTQSARIRNSGKVSMTFDLAKGIGTITLKHAKFGSDASSTWGMWCSTDSGASWKQIGSTVTTSSTTLQTATFTPNLPGPARCEVRKTDGTANRFNIDDITTTEYGSP